MLITKIAKFSNPIKLTLIKTSYSKPSQINIIPWHRTTTPIKFQFSKQNHQKSPQHRQTYTIRNKISELPYQQTNLQMLPYVLKLQPNKQQLNVLVKKMIQEICPELSQSKKQFARMQDMYKDLYTYIKNHILFEADPQLDNAFFQRAHYYFEKEGKKIRPLMIAMLSQNFKQIISKTKSTYIDFTKLEADIKKWSALIQIMHIASLAHDDIVDDSPSRRGQQSQHLKYGSKIAVFSGNYIISMASRTVSDFNSSRLYEIYANTMSSLAEGQIKQLIAKGQNKFVDQDSGKRQEKLKSFDEMIKRYMHKTYYKSAALMCGSLLGVPTIFQLHFGPQFQKILNKDFNQIEYISFKAGQHYGLALQLIDDILDYVSTAQQMGKQQMSDLTQGNVTSPVYLTYYHKKRIPSQSPPQKPQVSLQLLNRKKKSKEDALLVKSWVESGVGIQLTYILGAMHVMEGLKQLGKFGLGGSELRAWRYLGNKLMTRRK